MIQQPVYAVNIQNRENTMEIELTLVRVGIGEPISIH